MFGEWGLVKAIQDFADATDEVRIYLEYWDILAVNLGNLRSTLNIPRCLKRPNTWQDIDRILREEEQATTWTTESSAGGDGSKAPQPSNPVCDAVRAAAKAAGKDPRQVRWEIGAYAARCGYAHNGVANLIESKEWTLLAQKIYRDLAWLKRSTKELDWKSRDARSHMISALTSMKDDYYVHVGAESYQLLPKLQEEEKRRELEEEARAAAVEVADEGKHQGASHLQRQNDQPRDNTKEHRFFNLLPFLLGARGLPAMTTLARRWTCTFTWCLALVFTTAILS